LSHLVGLHSAFGNGAFLKQFYAIFCGRSIGAAHCLNNLLPQQKYLSMELRPVSHNNVNYQFVTITYIKTPCFPLSFQLLQHLAPTLLCLLFVYPNVIAYPKVLSLLTAYCIFVLVFLCTMCVCMISSVNKMLKSTYLLTYLELLRSGKRNLLRQSARTQLRDGLPHVRPLRWRL